MNEIYIFSLRLALLNVKSFEKQREGCLFFFLAHVLVVVRQEAFLIRAASAGRATSPVRFARALVRTPVSPALPLTSESLIWRSAFSNARKATTKVCRQKINLYSSIAMISVS